MVGPSGRRGSVRRAAEVLICHRVKRSSLCAAWRTSAVPRARDRARSAGPRGDRPGPADAVGRGPGAPLVATPVWFRRCRRAATSRSSSTSARRRRSDPRARAAAIEVSRCPLGGSGERLCEWSERGPLRRLHCRRVVGPSRTPGAEKVLRRASLSARGALKGAGSPAGALGEPPGDRRAAGNRGGRRSARGSARGRRSRPEGKRPPASWPARGRRPSRISRGGSRPPSEPRPRPAGASSDAGVPAGGGTRRPARCARGWA